MSTSLITMPRLLDRDKRSTVHYQTLRLKDSVRFPFIRTGIESYKRNYVIIVLLLACVLLLNWTLFNRRLPLARTARRTFDDRGIHVAFFGKFAYRKMKIVRGMVRMFHSILANTHSPVFLHVILDEMSRLRTSRTLRKVSRSFRRRLNITYYDVKDIADQNREAIMLMKKYFYSKDVGKYGDDIFFLSEVFHEAFPKRLRKVIFLDVDLKFQSDISLLHQKFEEFKEQNVIGIAPDLQPQYRVDFKEFRVRNPGTLVGSPGHQGFNTGVVLFHLEKMRQSQLYNNLLNDSVVEGLCRKYDFHGYLGHQDFYTLTGMEHPELYYRLDCTWNRQLDVGWRKETGPGVFEQYHDCAGKINVLHANGDSVLPEDE